MPDYEQLFADAHSLARDASYLNTSAKERLLNASNAIRQALSGDCELQNHMHYKSSEFESRTLDDGVYEISQGDLFSPSQLIISSGLQQPQAWEQSACASILYGSGRLSENHNAYTTYIPPRSHLELQTLSAVSPQLELSIAPYSYGIGKSAPFRAEPHYHASVRSQASAAQSCLFESNFASFPTPFDGLLEDTSSHQIPKHHIQPNQTAPRTLRPACPTPRSSETRLLCLIRKTTQIIRNL